MQERAPTTAATPAQSAPLTEPSCGCSSSDDERGQTPSLAEAAVARLKRIGRRERGTACEQREAPPRAGESRARVEDIC